MKIIKAVVSAILPSIISTLFLFCFLEGSARLLGVPEGAARYIETIVLQNGLTTRKPAGEFRIFAYGESTMHGSHYGAHSNPARWLEAYLKDFLPEKKIHVVNFARMGQGPAFIRASFRDTLAYKPDIAIFYMGHNVFLPGNRVDQRRELENSFKERFRELIRRSAFISGVYRLLLTYKMQRGVHAHGDQLGGEQIETGPSGLGPENKITREDQLFVENIAFYRDRVESVVRMGEQAKVPLIFFDPVGNLKDFAPYCSEHYGKLDIDSRKHWDQLFEEGKKAQATGDYTTALRFYETAYSLETQHADLAFRLGQMNLKKGELVRARQLFEEALDYDCIPVRALSETRKIFSDLAAAERVILMDTEKLVASEVPGGILGDPVIEDNVHFSVKGHSLIGRALAEEIADRGWLAPEEEWQFQKERPFQEVAVSLGVTPELQADAYEKCAAYMGSRYDTRILYAEKAAKILPQDPRVLRQLAWSYWLSGNREKAFEEYRKLGKLHPQELEAVLQAQPELKKAFQQSPPPAAV